MPFPPGREAKHSCMILQDGCKQLLPAIPNEITLLEIVPKLPWKTFDSLSLVSRAWFQKVRARQVYDARVLSHSRETLFIVRRRWETNRSTTMALYSTKDHSLTRLPPVPYHGYDCQWVSLDGKIYFLTGEEKVEDRRTSFWRCGRRSYKVFVLDVAGQGQWKECASMITPRRRFGCGVMNGKIYVFGGLPVLRAPGASRNWESASCPSEVYDPEENSWSPVRAMRTLRFGHRIEAVMGEFWVLGGSDSRGDYVDYDICGSDDYDTLEEAHLTWERIDVRKTTVEKVYHSINDVWGTKSSIADDVCFFLFVAQGKLYSMRLDWPSIDLYDVKTNLWTNVHEYFDIPIPGRHVYTEATMPRIRAVVAVDDELAIMVSWLAEDMGGEDTCVFESTGFGIKDEQILWQKSQFPISKASLPTRSNILIQL